MGKLSVCEWQLGADICFCFVFLCKKTLVYFNFVTASITCVNNSSKSGPTCSKLTLSLVNMSLKF